MKEAKGQKAKGIRREPSTKERVLEYSTYSSPANSNRKEKGKRGQKKKGSGGEIESKKIGDRRVEEREERKKEKKGIRKE